MRTDRYREVRRRQILELLSKHEYMTVNELSSRFRVTGATIRKDLQALMEQKQVIRTHGSAMIVRKQMVSPLEERLHIHAERKKAIGQTAVSLVKDDDIIGIDASSTALAMVPSLKAVKSLTIVTNSIAVINALIEEDHIRLLMPGGKVNHRTASIVGNSVLDYLKELRLNTAFVGARSMSADMGLGEDNEEEVEVKKSMLKIARKRVALVDSSKYNGVALVSFGTWEMIDHLITDSHLKLNQQKELKAFGVNVHIARVE